MDRRFLFSDRVTYSLRDIPFVVPYHLSQTPLIPSLLIILLSIYPPQFHNSIFAWKTSYRSDSSIFPLTCPAGPARRRACVSFFSSNFPTHSLTALLLLSQVGFAELKETTDDRANIGGTTFSAPIVGQQLAQYILTNHQDADCRPIIRLYCRANCRLADIGPMFRLILLRQSLVCLHWTDVWVTIDPPIYGS